MPTIVPHPAATSLQDRHPARSGYRELGFIAAFWVVVALLTIVQEAFDPRFDEQVWNPSEALFTFLKYMIWAILTPVIFRLIGWIGEARQAWMQVFLHSITGIAISAVVHFIYHIMWNALIPESPQSMSMLYVLSGLHFLPEFLLYLVVLAAGFARDYFFRYRERLHEAAHLRAEAAEWRASAAELRAQLADARLQSLHMQINPHFLFNTLHTIHAYVERDPKGTRRIISLLSRLLRYTLDTTDEKEVPLEQELEFLNGYLDIQSIRFRGHLDIHRNIDPDVLDALVPNLILQPLVENAVKHGISALESGGCIELHAWREGDQLHLSVRDNGPGLTIPGGDGAPTNGIGLKNTRKRLATLYRDEHRLTLQNMIEGGVEAHITLPYHTRRDLYTTIVDS